MVCWWVVGGEGVLFSLWWGRVMLPMWECCQCQCCQLSVRRWSHGSATLPRAGCRVAPPRWRLSMWRRGARRKRCRRWRNGCDPRAAATRKMRVVPVRRVRRPRPTKHPRQARPLPREGARDVREAARVDARPPRVGRYFSRRLSVDFGPKTQRPFLVGPSCRRPSSLRSTFTW